MSPAALRSGSALGWTALILFAAPLTAVNASLLISIAHEKVPACLPYLDGAISVSRAGRNPPASYFFKAVTIPCGFLGILYWPFAARRLAELSGRELLLPRESAMAWLGAIGAALLIVYAFALGNPGDLYRLMRRAGVYAYFAGITFAQILFAVNVRALSRRGGWNFAAPLLIIWTALAAMLLLAGAGLPLLYFASGSKSVAERTVEWNYLIPMHLFFLASFFVWRKTTVNGRQPTPCPRKAESSR